MTYGVVIHTADATEVPHIMPVMNRAFDPAFGEAWSEGQCVTMLTLPNADLFVARAGLQLCGFALTRMVVDEMELLLIAVDPHFQRHCVGVKLLDQVIAHANARHLDRIFLEVREGNSAINLYKKAGFQQIGQRNNYYSGNDGLHRHALTFSLELKNESA